LMLSNCGVGEDSWKSLGLQGNQISNSKAYPDIHFKTSKTI